MVLELVLIVELFWLLTVPNLWRVSIIFFGVFPLTAWILGYQVSKLLNFVLLALVGTLTGFLIYGITITEPFSYQAGIGYLHEHNV